MPRISAASLGEHRAQTLDRIFEAVSRLSHDRGIDTISMTDVAATAGITRTALYNYFPDKTALLLGFAERVTTYFIDSFERELPTDATAAVRVEAFIGLQLSGLLAHPHPGAAEITTALGPDAYEALAAHTAPMQRILRDIIADGTAAGEFRELDADATARSVLAVIGAERLPLLSGHVTPRDAQRTVADFVLTALRAPASD